MSADIDKKAPPFTALSLNTSPSVQKKQPRILRSDRRYGSHTRSAHLSLTYILMRSHESTLAAWHANNRPTHCFQYFCAHTIGNFTLAYSGETTSPIAYDAGAAEMLQALANLSTLTNTNVTTESVNCSTPEVTCGWRVTFVGFRGDAEMLLANADDLGGNAAVVSVVEETKGQIAADLVGSPAKVRCTFETLLLCA